MTTYKQHQVKLFESSNYGCSKESSQENRMMQDLNAFLKIMPLQHGFFEVISIDHQLAASDEADFVTQLSVHYITMEKVGDIQ